MPFSNRDRDESRSGRLCRETLSQIKLSKESTDELLTTLDHSVSSVDISLVSALPLQRNLAFMLARKHPEMSEEECEKLLSILREGD